MMRLRLRAGMFALLLAAPLAAASSLDRFSEFLNATLTAKG